MAISRNIQQRRPTGLVAGAIDVDVVAVAGAIDVDVVAVSSRASGSSMQ